MPTQSPKLLLVDDDPLALEIISRALGQYPSQVRATSAAQALERARAERPDVILLDAEMPGMSGFELCRLLRGEAALATVPIIFTTAHGDAQFELQALESGASDFITKPIVPEQLRARIRMHLRSAAPGAAGGGAGRGSGGGGGGGGGRAPASPGRASLALAESDPSRRRAPVILIVDDEVSAIQALQGVLAPLGSVHFATSGMEALTLTRQLQPDLLLLDLRMPHMSGFEVLATLREDPAFRHLPVVIVTGAAEREVQTRALELGAADFIVKPFNAAVVRARLRNLLAAAEPPQAAAPPDAGALVARLDDSRWADIAAGLVEGLVVADAAGRIVWANAAACALLGRSESECIGAPLALCFGAGWPPPGPDAAAAGVRARVALVASEASEASEAGAAGAAGQDPLVWVSMSRISRADGELQVLLMSQASNAR